MIRMTNRVGTRFPKKTTALIVLMVIALFSFFVVSRIVAAPSFNSAAKKSLEEKKSMVTKLAATAMTTSTAITFMPGDAATPIANQLADITAYLVVVLSAIALEKILVVVAGYVSFAIIIPIACLLGMVALYSKEEQLKILAIKLTAFAVVFFMAIPACIHASDFIGNSYHNLVAETIKTAEQNTEYIEEKKEDLSKEDKHWWEKVGEYLSNVTSSIGSGISDIIKKGEDTLSALIDAIATMIITCCVVPVAVMVLFFWILKILLGINIPTSLLRKPRWKWRARGVDEDDDFDS